MSAFPTGTRNRPHYFGITPEESMSLNPNLPLDDSIMDAGEMRSQLNGLKEIIDVAPAITGVSVDAHRAGAQRSCAFRVKSKLACRCGDATMGGDERRTSKPER